MAGRKKPRQRKGEGGISDICTVYRGGSESERRPPHSQHGSGLGSLRSRVSSVTTFCFFSIPVRFPRVISPLLCPQLQPVRPEVERGCRSLLPLSLVAGGLQVEGTWLSAQSFRADELSDLMLEEEGGRFTAAASSFP